MRPHFTRSLATGINPVGAPNPVMMGAAGGGFCLLLIAGFMLRRKFKGVKRGVGEDACLSIYNPEPGILNPGS